MAKSKTSNQPALNFDGPDEIQRLLDEAAKMQAEAAALLTSTTSTPEWHEVPQARFLSWPAAMQFAYCAARDEFAAQNYNGELNDWWVAFHTERAKSYRALIGRI